MTSLIMSSAQPFFYRGGETGCLCLHGFTASPAETRWLGESLAARGMTVYGARHAGHGTHPRDLARTHWRDWLASALDGYYLLKANCDRVCVVGHSMGGLVALLLTLQVEVTAVAALATPVLFSRRVGWARWLRYLRPYTDQADRSSLPDVIRAEQERRGEPVIGRVRYDRWSTAAVSQMVDLAQVVNDRLPEVNTPLLLIYSRGDQTVSPQVGDHLAARAGSSVLEHHTLARSGHILPQDVERETVFQLVGDFFLRQTQG